MGRNVSITKISISMITYQYFMHHAIWQHRGEAKFSSCRLFETCLSVSVSSMQLDDCCLRLGIGAKILKRAEMFDRSATMVAATAERYAQVIKVFWEVRGRATGPTTLTRRSRSEHKVLIDERIKGRNRFATAIRNRKDAIRKKDEVKTRRFRGLKTSY